MPSRVYLSWKNCECLGRPPRDVIIPEPRGGVSERFAGATVTDARRLAKIVPRVLFTYRSTIQTNMSTRASIDNVALYDIWWLRWSRSGYTSQLQ